MKMLRVLVFAIILAKLVKASILLREEPFLVPINDNEVRFFAFGDGGGPEDGKLSNPVPGYCANLMLTLMKERSAQFVVGTGDNIYPRGVNCSTDPLFRDRFENVYGHQLGLPWYLIAGNHDWYQNAYAQVEYTGHSNYWKFPALFYSVRFMTKNKELLLELVFIDTQYLCGGTWDFKNNIKIKGDQPPFNPAEKAEDMWKWISERLEKSQAKYLFVVGHYPMFSCCGGNPKKGVKPYDVSVCMANRLQKMFTKYEGTGYISGHEHNLQYATVTHQGHLWHQIVSGAGHLIRPKEKVCPHIEGLQGHLFYPTMTQLSKTDGEEIGGVAYLKLTEDTGSLEFHITNGKEDTTIGKQYTIQSRRKIRHDTASKTEKPETNHIRSRL